MVSPEGVHIEGFRFWVENPERRDARAILQASLAACSQPHDALKRGRRKALFVTRHEGIEYLVKANRYAPGPRSWLRSSKARREWQRTRAAARRGIPTPALFAAGEERSALGGLRRCVTVVERLPGARDLAALWRNPAHSSAARRELARALGASVAAMHRAGIHQDDLAPNNFLIVAGTGAGPPRILPIDFERAQLGSQVSERDRIRSLAKLYRYLYDAPATLCWRFLHAYEKDEIEAARRLATRVMAELPGLFRRDCAHLRRSAAETNRRFRVLPAGQGWAHRAVEDELVGRVLEGGIGAATPSDSVWTRTVVCASRREAFEGWVQGQALMQRGGLMARPLALLALRGDPRRWIWISERRSGEVAADTGLAPRATRVLTRRVRALGLPAPASDHLLGCRESPGARLLLPPDQTLAEKPG